MNTNKGSSLVLVLVAILLAALASFVYITATKTSTTNKSPTQTPTSKYITERAPSLKPLPTNPAVPIPTLNPSVNWKLFSYDDCGRTQSKAKFSISLPSNWILNSFLEEHIYASYSFTDGNDKLSIQCGTGFGGGCNPDNVNYFYLNGESEWACYDPSANELLEIGATSNPNPSNNFSSVSFSIRGHVNDINLLKQILSTFKIIN